MDKYTIVDSVEHENKIPFPEELCVDVMQFQFRKNTKLGGIIAKIEKEFKNDQVRRVILHSVGDCCAKCIACVEIIKQRQKQILCNLFQWNVLQCFKSTDIWSPNLTADQQLDRLVVEKYIPQIFVMISRDPFPENTKCDRQQSFADVSPSFQNRLQPNNKSNLLKTYKLTSDLMNTTSSGIMSGKGKPETLKRENKWKRQPRQLKKKTVLKANN